MDTQHHDENTPLKPAPGTFPIVLVPATSVAFMTLISDSLRLRQETLAMAFVYHNKYFQYIREDPTASDLLDEHTLVLASLSLATKATESPRRLRELLLPAHELLNPTSDPLTFPSTLYDSLRSTLVTAELLLLRVLKFDIRLPLAFDYLPRYLEKTLTLGGTGHLDSMREDEKEEISAVDVKDTMMGKRAWSLAGEAAKTYRLVNLFPPKTVAAAVVYVCLEEMEVKLPVERAEWVRKLTGDRVEFEDFEEAVEDVRALRW